MWDQLQVSKNFTAGPISLHRTTIIPMSSSLILNHLLIKLLYNIARISNTCLQIRYFCVVKKKIPRVFGGPRVTQMLLLYTHVN